MNARVRYCCRLRTYASKSTSFSDPPIEVSPEMDQSGRISEACRRLDGEDTGDDDVGHPDAPSVRPIDPVRTPLCRRFMQQDTWQERDMAAFHAFCSTSPKIPSELR